MSETTTTSETTTQTSGRQPPGAGSAQSVAFSVSRLGASVGSELSRSLEPLGIEPRHFGLLRALSHSEGETQRAVGTRLGLHPNRMVALVDELEKRKLVRRRPHPSDRRAHTVVLTAAGEKLLQEAFMFALGIERTLCADLSEDERSQLLDLLSRLRVLDGTPPGVHPGLAGTK
jgi:DNA-binding MarR family transcriptional regulator